MKKITNTLLAALALCGAGCASTTETAEAPLKDIFEGKFMIGAAMNANQISGGDSIALEIAKRHFNTIVAENVMKSEKIHPEKDKYEWAAADSFVNFGCENGMFVVGHCLVWHSQLAPWFAYDDNGKYVCADTLKSRMHDHIHALMSRYKGKVKGWDVVNEAIVEDGSYRKSPFYDILGEEFIPLAFEYAHEADPDAQLYINDYGMNVKGRRDAYVKIVNDLKERGLRIDAIGMQAHMGMDYPDLGEFEESLMAFAGTGCNVMITEFDMSALPTVSRSANVSDIVKMREVVDPYPNGLPAGVSEEWNARMLDVMNLLLRHSDVISRVNVWGVEDGSSWKNDYPVRGRTDYPVFFGRDYQMKPFLKELAAGDCGKRSHGK
ncbi:MAG: endo-1,4-beta-xylanase [Clostridium sp.]|nr:endo-1,4-beta-xylanase [Clostridium sp.]